jgi:hypothetical protein
MTRSSLRRGWLAGRVRALFSHAPKDPVDERLDVEKPDWEAEDHLESPAVDAPVVDPWEADAALGIEAAEPKGSSYQRATEHSQSDSGGGPVDKHSPRSGETILKSVSPESTQDELPLSAPALEVQGACPSLAEREPPEQRVCTRSTEKHAERTLNADGHYPGLERTCTEHDVMGSAEEQVQSDGSAHDGISDDLGNEEFEFLKAIDVELQDHETFLAADITDEYFDYDADAHQLPWSERDAGDALYGNVVRRDREKAASIGLQSLR